MTAIPALGAVALGLAAGGCFVHPLAAGQKTPATRSGFHDATRDPQQIRAWWETSPRRNVGIATGPSGLIVIDADRGKPWNPDWGEQPQGCLDGADILLALAEDPDEFLGQKACNATTPSGGRHFYFRPPDGQAGRFRSGTAILPWVDVRAQGGYVVAPFSVTEVGAYRPGPGWVRDAQGAVRIACPEIPRWLAGLLPTRSEKPSQSVDALAMVEQLNAGGGYAAAAINSEASLVAAAGEGVRNHTLNRAAFKLGTLVGASLAGEAEVAGALAAAAAACGLGDAEAQATIRSGMRAGIAKPRQVKR